MKKIILLILLGITLSLYTSAQAGGPITIEKKGLRKSYIQDGKILAPKQLGSVLSSDEAASKHFRTARIDGYVAYGAIGVGAIFAGMGLYNSIKAAQATNDGDLAASTDYSNKSTADLLITAGCFVVSLPFMVLSNSQIGKSINVYNSSRKTGRLDKLDLYVGMTGNGATVRLRF
jgi:hypothetical protein